jgi:GT2 family glycosyltransferase
MGERRALGIRCEAFNSVGGFDESFFTYFEGADLCRRMKKAVWQVHFAPVTTVEHVGSASSKQVRADMAAQLLHSTDLFYHRHSSRSRVAVMSLVVKSLMLARWIGGTLRLVFTRDAKKCSAIAESIAASKKSAPWGQAMASALSDQSEHLTETF